MISFGNIPVGAVLPIPFASYAGATGASVTLTGPAVTDIEVYKGTSMTQRSSDAGYALMDTDGIDIDGITGIHGFSIDTGDNTDAGFYAAGSFYTVVVSAVTIDSQTVNFIAAVFRLVAAEASTLDAAGVRSAVGLASANLDTQLSAIDDFLDTEVAGIKVVTDKVHTMVESAGGSPGDYRFHADALVNVADVVWDEPIAGHANVGSTGAALSAAGSAGDPWSTALPGAYGAGTAGKIIGDNINATVSSRASQTSLDTLDDLVDTEVAAIKAKTDNLPTDPADASDVAAAVAAVKLYADRTVVRGTVSGTSPTTTTFTSSALSPAGVAADQFKGRIIVFDNDTTTTALRGQATDITASSAASNPLFTFTALTTAPQSGDTFSIL